eukprot:925059-Amphidinium_carterae.1
MSNPCQEVPQIVNKPEGIGCFNLPKFSGFCMALWRSAWTQLHRSTSKSPLVILGAWDHSCWTHI